MNVLPIVQTLGIYAVQDEATRASGWRSLSQDVQLRDALAVARR